MLPDEFLDPLKDWHQSLESFSIPRQVSPLVTVPVKRGLHVFTDASEKGFGAAIYLRAESKYSLDVSLFIAKASRILVVAIKTLTIPRLELQGAVVPVKLSYVLTFSNLCSQRGR